MFLPMDPRGETLEGLDGEGVGAEGVPWVTGIFEGVVWSMWG